MTVDDDDFRLHHFTSQWDGSNLQLSHSSCSSLSLSFTLSLVYNIPPFSCAISSPLAWLNTKIPIHSATLPMNTPCILNYVLFLFNWNTDDFIINPILLLSSLLLLTFMLFFLLSSLIACIFFCVMCRAFDTRPRTQYHWERLHVSRSTGLFGQK